MNKTECKQEKCAFRKGSPMQHMCPRCSECGCEPHMIDEDCTNCWNCMKDEDFIRAGKPDGQKEEQGMVMVIKENGC